MMFHFLFFLPVLIMNSSHKNAKERTQILESDHSCSHPHFVFRFRSCVPGHDYWLFLKFSLLINKTGIVSVLLQGWKKCLTNILSSMYACVLSSVWLFATPWTVALQTPLSTEFSRQEYWSELPFPTPGHLPSSVIEPRSSASLLLAGRSFTTAPPGKPHWASSLTYNRCSMKQSYHYELFLLYFEVGQRCP